MVLHGLKNCGIRGETDAVVFFDFATHWLDAILVKSRTNAETLHAFRQVIDEISPVNTFSRETDREYAPPAVWEVYCDKAREFVSMCRNVGIKVEHSTPGMPRTNAIAESRDKLVLHRTRAALRQAGLAHGVGLALVATSVSQRTLPWRRAPPHTSSVSVAIGSPDMFFLLGVLLITFRLRLVLKRHERWLIMMLCLEMVKSMLLRARMSSDAMIFRNMKSCLMIPKSVQGTAYSSSVSGDGFDDDEPDEVPDITSTGTGRVTSYEKRGKFAATSKPGTFWDIIMKWVPSGTVTTWSLIRKILSRMQSDQVFIK